MNFTTNPKEHTMKATLTSSYVRFTAVLAVAAPIAALVGTSRIS